MRQILLHDKGVIALCSRSVHMALRRGPPIWHITYITSLRHAKITVRLTTGYSNDDMEDLRCMSFTSKGTSELLVAGLQDVMFTIDVEKGTVLKQVYAHAVPFRYLQTYIKSRCLQPITIPS